MNKRELKRRWSLEDFRSEQSSAIEALRTPNTNLAGLDLRGIGLGNVEPFDFSAVTLGARRIVDCDFSSATVSSFLGKSEIENCLFREAELKKSNFNKARLHHVRFDQAKLESCFFNDAAFVDCSFRLVKVKDRQKLACPWLRAEFANCDFSGASIRRAEFRAARFVNCTFDDAEFSQCDLRGVKFVGGAPKQLIDCYLGGTLVDGEPIAAK
ncbi:pentapeptide repeat-containing protein [Blastopirellula marina]|uniref:Pentapeptide repeat-containing protein n=1 Tax=Blastopirellula marina TaxID=124 RepID=A0A2S8FTN8_9BACT|nr:pentapeptide repeat-containing protein [Blastopirellula marina]PQO35420.1 hypothetical protein C5Y98_13740 [Blastopirellula marina]PQO41411.1 hypothetical protein C5Y93_30305 [Blastopirellula marina]PTL44060.1 pentapeptide repeat-containing protein [Blastopirellula marina]